jgi:hypothetical protein
VLDSEGDQKWGGFGVSARLRDVASANWCWRTAMRSMADESYRSAGANLPASPAGYGYHWWALPPGPTGIHRGAFLASGAFGQYFYVNPTEPVVAAFQSAWCQHLDSDAEAETFALLGAAVRALRPDPPFVGPGALPAQMAAQGRQRRVVHCPSARLTMDGVAPRQKNQAAGGNLHSPPLLSRVRPLSRSDRQQNYIRAERLLEFRIT